MTKEEAIKQIEREKIMPVIRTATTERAREVIEAILKGGLNVLEITMSVPNALELIREFSENPKNPNVLVGAGTVLDAKTTRKCIESGARFIVSPVFNKEIIKICNEAEITVISGAMTPTEIHTAWKTGADFIKIFPINSVGGSNYIKAVLSVFPEIKIIPTGGVAINNADEYIKSGAIAIGIGGKLIKGTDREIIENCRTLLENL